MSASRKVALVLGSGGARGLAHIGVIDWLEERDYEIVAVSGSSIGALVAGIYARGKLAEFKRWVCAIRTTDMIKLLDFDFSSTGLVSGQRIIDALKELTGDSRIEDLQIPFTAVATDLQAQKEVWLNSGSLFDAIRASISLPMFFKPARVDGKLLLDGGILNPVPIAPVFNTRADMIVAVNLGGTPDPDVRLADSPPDDAPDEDIASRITSFIQSLDFTGRSAQIADDSMLSIIDQSFDAMQAAIARQQLAAYPPDVELMVPIDVCGMLEFDRAEELIQMGYDLAAAKLQEKD